MPHAFSQKGADLNANSVFKFTIDLNEFFFFFIKYYSNQKENNYNE